MKHHVPEDADELSALRRLYPELSDQEYEEARARLDQYVRIMIRMAHRITDDPEAYEEIENLLDDNQK